jgi:peptide chain release factor 2
MRERNKLAAGIDNVLSLERELKDTIELVEMAEAEGDASLVDEAARTLAEAQKRAAKAELEALLSGEADGNDRGDKNQPGHRLERGWRFS